MKKKFNKIGNLMQNRIKERKSKEKKKKKSQLKKKRKMEDQ